ncbi:MAG: HAMP domain-containing histidine kinase [Clostridia bacterium]|nr:HAMP domain-containing histidine kinase [Clostridia bacterium]
MIKKTQHKFIAITLGAISLVLALILGLLNLSIYMAVLFNTHENITLIRDSRGIIFSNQNSFSPPENNAPFDAPDGNTRLSYIYVRINNKNASAPPFITTNMTGTYSGDEIYYLAEHLIKIGETEGIYQDMMYEITQDDLFTEIVVADISADIAFLTNLFRMSVAITVASLLIVFIFSYYLSKWAIKPVKTALENQRRFISDASHELKTPLAVISANADVLESEIGSNKWLSNIKNQADDMSSLVFDLLDLAKIDETADEIVVSEFDLSNVVLSKSLEFECTAFESGKTFEQNITDGITFKGNEESIRHLVTILIDNAIKHSDEKGIIRVTLTSSGNKKIFQVYNTGNGIRNSEKDKIFERFYRSDESRSKSTGGYGLGLSIAKSIVDAHGGTISVDSDDSRWISFTVVL